jgi:hypothetical protein
MDIIDPQTLHVFHGAGSASLIFRFFRQRKAYPLGNLGMYYGCPIHFIPDIGIG